MAQQPQDKYVLRLPDGLRDRIKQAAEESRRSMNAEIIATLEEKYPARLPVAWAVYRDGYLVGVELAEPQARQGEEFRPLYEFVAPLAKETET